MQISVWHLHPLSDIGHSAHVHRGAHLWYVKLPVCFDITPTLCSSEEGGGGEEEQALAMLLPSEFLHGPATIAFFGDRTGCTQTRGARPTVKFGGIANRAIKAAFWNAGFQETSSSNWNVLWGSFMQRTALRSLKAHQICNHWPGTWELGRKDLFYQCATTTWLVCNYPPCNECMYPICGNGAGM